MTIRSDRRGILAASAALPLIGMAAPSARAEGGVKRGGGGGAARADEVSTPADLVVATTGGRVRGYRRGTVASFKGVPYAQAARFAPPGPPAAWSGVRDCMVFGPISPQPIGRRQGPFAFLAQPRGGDQDEACHVLNVWTPAADGKGRPVMVWLHGGNFSTGSGHELATTDGEGLARRGDVVVVSINHRLNLFGYCDLVAAGAPARFADATNLGMRDIVAALEWVRDNIAAFGGDPGCVTVFGQSGGGIKVTALNAMPSARGLFHRAIVQSGSAPRLFDTAMTAPLARALLAEFGLTPARAEGLLEVPTQALAQAGAKVADRFALTGFDPKTGRDVWYTVGWAPRPDGDVIAGQPYDAAMLAQFAHVPLLVGSTRHEANPALGDPALEAMTMEQLAARLAPRYREPAAVAAAFAAANPGQKPVALAAMISSAGFNRANAVAQARAKAAGNGAGAWLYRFDWEPAILDGRPRAYHCADLVHCFHAVEAVPEATGADVRARRMADRVADAWIAFARSGDPSHPGLPHWPAVTRQAQPTMLLDDTCRVVAALDSDLRAMLDRYELR